jgi:hypothetical protein
LVVYGGAPTLLSGIFLLSGVPDAPAAQRKADERAAEDPASRTLAIKDYFAIRRVSDPRISPDGRWVAYTVTTIDRQADKSESRIYE